MQQRPQLGLHPLQALALEVVVGQQVVPQHITGRRHQQPGQHPAHAVADEHHVLRRRAAAGRVEMLERVVERRVDLEAVQRNRRVGRVIDLPHLEVLAQLRITHDLVGHVHPRLGAAAQAVQHEDDAAVRVPRLHQVHVRFADAFAQAKQRAQRLRGKPRLRQPHAVGGGEVAGQRHLFAVQVHAFGGLGRIHIEQHLGGLEHLLQAVALEAQQRGGVDRRHLAVLRNLRLGPVRRGHQLGRVHHHHQLGTEAIAPVGTAQAGKAHRRGRHHAGGNAGHAQFVEVRGQRPALAGHRGVVVLALQRTLAGALEHHRRGLLGGVVVVVAHLGLAVFEGTVRRRAPTEEQVGIGVTRRFQPRIQRRVAHRVLVTVLRLGAQAQCGLHPQLRQCRQALFFRQHGGVFQGLLAGGHVLGAQVLVQSDHAQGFLRCRAELARGEHVAALVGQVVGGCHLLHGDHGAAAGQQQRQHHRQQRQQAAGEGVGHGHGAVPCCMPGTPWRITCENAGSLPAARARSVMRPRAFNVAKSTPGVSTPRSRAYSAKYPDTSSR